MTTAASINQIDTDTRREAGRSSSRRRFRLEALTEADHGLIFAVKAAVDTVPPFAVVH